MLRIGSGNVRRSAPMIAACLFVLGGLVSGCGSNTKPAPEGTAPVVETPETAPTTRPTPTLEPELEPSVDFGPLYKVTRVTDGDTISVDYGGTIEKVRLIAIDTPEVDWYGSQGGCFGDEAGNFTRQKLAGARVHLVRDGAQEDRDRYGRLLRFVVLEDGTNFNALLVSKGFATYESQYPVAEPFLSQLENASDAALASNAGLWSACR
jgi:micrococcal nuclease